MVKLILAQVKQYKKASLLTPVFTAAEVVMEVLIPFISALVIDRGIQAGNLSQILLYGGLMLVMAFLSLVFGVLAGRYGAMASAGLACNLREAMFGKIQTYSFANIDKFSTAGLVTRLTTDVTNIQNAYQMCLRMAIRAPLMFLFSIIMCCTISPRLSSIFFVAVVFLAIALSLVIATVTRIFNQVFKKYDDLNAEIQENVSAIRVVKAFVREDFEKEKFYNAANNLYKLFVKAEKRVALNGPIMMVVIYGCMVSLSWFGGRSVVFGEITPGQLSSLFNYIMNVLMSLMILSMVFVMLSMSIAAMKRVAEVLSEVPDIQQPKQPIHEMKDGSVEFSHVHFSYRHTGGEEVLEDINLNIHSGETIGIIGGTGCGKSSLVSLISRLYDVDKGSVKVGGVDVRDYDMEFLRNSVAVVLQKNVLFSGTILDNLRWGNEEATEEQCMDACKKACAHDFVMNFPKGYETWIEQGGTNVSGGQKQRLCIARALLKNPKVLILDDSTSAVDTATDARIRKAFREEIPDVTKIIIAQRVSAIESADRILVLDDGKVVGFDTHEHLLQNNDIYREIYQVQTQGGGDFDGPTPDAVPEGKEG